MRGGVEVTPTRLNLLRSKRRLARVREGATLLRRKREALVRELLSHARPAVDARERIGRAASEAYPALVDALGEEGSQGVRTAAQPLRDLSVTMQSIRVWGMPVGSVRETPEVERTLEARGTAPGPTTPAAIDAASAFETLTRLLLDAAPREMLLRQLGESVAQTSRQVRALEHRVEPTLIEVVARITRLLDEREREEHVRLRQFMRGRIPEKLRRS